MEAGTRVMGQERLNTLRVWPIWRRHTGIKDDGKRRKGLEVQVFVTAVTEGKVGSRNHHFDSEIGPWTVYKLVFCRSLSNKAFKHSTLCFAPNIAMKGEKSI
jgi:hypothetical protein